MKSAIKVIPVFAALLLLCGVNAQEPMKAPPKFDPVALFKKADTNGDGKLSKDEFLKLAEVSPRYKGKPDEAKQVFDRLDADKSGDLSFDEFRKLFTQTKVEPTPRAAKTPTPEQLAFFEKKIRPVLVEHCYKCHSAASDKIRGGLLVDSREGLRRGGDSGPALTPGDVRGSLLLKAMRHEEDLKMPAKKLSASVIADFESWIKMGAPDPREGKAIVKKNIDIEKGREFWAFHPLKLPKAAAIKNSTWPRDDVDRFLLAHLEAKGLTPVADADRHTLLRRVYLDLIGLPPTPEEIDAYLKDTSDQAFAKVVDQLLASPRFGERWGRHWLDVARFAESSGKEVDFAFPQAWRYRDYVIASFNADKPFDQFIKEQLAGDLLPAANARQEAKQLIATGFLAIGPKSYIEKNKLQFELDVADEQIETTTQAFLGLTVSCARCHDHKFDPIPQVDYYALSGIFRSTQTYGGTIAVVQNNNPGKLLSLPDGCGLPAGISTLTTDERTKLEKQIAGHREKLRELQKAGKFASLEFVQTRLRLVTLEAKLPIYEADGTPKLLAMGVRDKASAADSPLYVRGEVEKPGQVVPRGFLQVVHHAEATAITKGSGRLELARWIASKDNPLTARVYVNRVWSHLFGRGLVATPDNFGVAGSRPSHPELLDHLAVTFMEDGWSTKKLIRRLVLSRAYRLASTNDQHNFEADPENTLIWRMTPRRLDAESIRDAMLAIAGKLDLTPPVGSMVAVSGEGYAAGVVVAGVGPLDQRSNHRSIYLPILRGQPLESLALFDGVDGSVGVGQRNETIIPAQSLYLLNSPHVLKLAEAAATRLAKERADETERVQWAYQRWFGRAATKAEETAALKFIHDYRDRGRKTRTAIQAESAAWAAFCQSLWASGDFLVRR